MGRCLLLNDHRVRYYETGLPLWFSLVHNMDLDILEIIIIGGNTEAEIRERLESKGEVLNVVQLWSLLDRARIMASFIRELG